MDTEYKPVPSEGSPPLATETDGSGDAKEGKGGNEYSGNTHNQLGLVNGVIVPCSLNILGVVLFLWIPWAVGQAGGGALIGMFVIGELQVHNVYADSIFF